MTVLIITKTDDNECIETVTRAIEARGGRTFRFDTNRFPTEARLALEYGPGGGTRGRRLVLEDEGRRFDLETAGAIWYRRVNVCGRLPKELEAQMKHACVLESKATFSGMMASLGVYQLNRPIRVRWAGNKELQLEIAREVGLEIPKTLITNDPDSVRAFAASCPGGVVAKMLSSFAILEEGLEKVVFTNRMTDADLEDLSGLDLSPMTFQEAVEKKLELRVTIVGHRIFTASIDSQALARAKVDWRREGVALIDEWKEYELPAGIGDKLFRLMDRLGLDYGAIDFIVTPEGTHVFLEINPAGEFFWLEKTPGFPISDAIAEALLEPKARRSAGGAAELLI